MFSLSPGCFYEKVICFYNVNARLVLIFASVGLCTAFVGLVCHDLFAFASFCLIVLAVASVLFLVSAVPAAIWFNLDFEVAVDGAFCFFCRVHWFAHITAASSVTVRISGLRYL